VRGCEPLELPAGEARLSLPAGVLAPYLLRLRSAGTVQGAASPGRVVSAGTASQGDRHGVELDLQAPARLVLAESFNRGRRAQCDGQDLGEPEVGGVYGTAWRVPASCKDVEITFAPDRLVKAGYAVSILAVLVLIQLVIRGSGRTDPLTVTTTPARRATAKHAALAAIPAGLALGFLFAARATPLFVLLVFVVLWRGIDAKRLSLAGGAILAVAVPILTLIIRPENRGGFNPDYTNERIAVHWVAVAGVTLLILALARALAGGGWAPARWPGRKRRRSPASRARSPRT
jgi:hypothetical protein